MAVWGLSVLIVLFTFLAYWYPPATWTMLLQWMRPGKRRLADEKAESISDDSLNGRAHSAPRLVHDANEELTSKLNGRSGNEAISGSAKSPEAEPEDQSTPKTTAAQTSSSVPSFSLDCGDDDIEPEEQSPESPKAVFPAPNSAQRASAMPPPPKPTQPTPKISGLPPKTAGRPASQLMPSPARAPAAQMRAAAGGVASLRVPSSGPLPNRGPPTQQSRTSLGPTTTVSTPNSRGKVLLSPGHSPLDWAALTKSQSNTLPGVPAFMRVTPSMLKRMTGRKGKPAWSSWQGKVYNITPYLPFHPGGEAELMKAAGRDGGKLFMEVHPWVNWENMLGSCLVGVLVAEDDGKKVGGESLEDLD